MPLLIRISLAALALGLSLPALADVSGYKFLEAVRKRDGVTVTEALSAPGSTLVNTADVTSGETALHIVTRDRQAAWVEFLLSHGANPNARNRKGETALSIATNLNFVEGVEHLIKGGARIDEPAANGETALMAAVHNRNTGLVRLLIAAGADPERPDNSGRSARDYAKLDAKGSPLLAELDGAPKRKRSNASAATYGPSL